MTDKIERVTNILLMEFLGVFRKDAYPHEEAKMENIAKQIDEIYKESKNAE